MPFFINLRRLPLGIPALLVGCTFGSALGSMVGCAGPDIEYQDTPTSWSTQSGPTSGSTAELGPGPANSSGSTLATSSSAASSATSSATSSAPTSTTGTTSSTTHSTSSPSSSSSGVTDSSSSQITSSSILDTSSTNSGDTQETGSSSTDSSETGTQSSDSDLPSSTGDSSTGDSSTGDSSTADDSGSTSGTDTGTENKDEIPTSGMTVKVNLEGFEQAAPHPRVLMAQIAITPPQSTDPADASDPTLPSLPWMNAGAQFKLTRIVRDYPLSVQGDSAQIKLPALNADAQNSDLGRSNLFMVALYNDQDQDKTWTQADGFLAASPHLYFSEPSPKLAGAFVWQSWQRLEHRANFAQVPSSELDRNQLGIQPLKRNDTLTLFRFGAPPRALVFGGLTKAKSMSPRVRFLATVGALELEDLPTHYLAGPRLLDKPLFELSDKKVKRWRLSQADLQALPPLQSGKVKTQAMPMQIPSGLSVAQLLARPIVGYARPVGAPVQAPGEYLTADSTLIAPLCVPNQQAETVHLAGIFAELKPLEPGNALSWFDAPIGALHAASIGLSQGWSLGWIEQIEAELGRVHERNGLGHQGIMISPIACGAPAFGRKALNNSL